MVEKETDIDVDLIIKNAQRLNNDAKCLKKNASFASAYALAVLALEELGKAFLKRYCHEQELSSLRKKYSYHRIKQCIVPSIYMAGASKEAMTTYLRERGYEIKHRDEISEWQAKNEVSFWEFDDGLRESMANSVLGSDNPRFLNHSKIGALDKAKQSALYIDKEFIDIGLTPFDFTEEHAEDVISRFDGALDKIEDHMIAHMTLAIFKSALRDDP